MLHIKYGRNAILSKIQSVLLKAEQDFRSLQFCKHFREDSNFALYAIGWIY